MTDYDLTPDGAPVVDWSSCDVPCAELEALAEELVLRGVRLAVVGPNLTMGWQVIYQGASHWTVSVIYNPVSLGHEAGLLEAAYLPGLLEAAYQPVRDVKGWLTAADVLREFPPMEAS